MAASPPAFLRNHQHRPSVHFFLWRLGMAEATTQTTQTERDTMARLATGKRSLVEIGVWHGITTSRLRQAMASDGVLWAVDPYFRSRIGVCWAQMIAHNVVGKTPGGNVQWVRMLGAEAAEARRADPKAGPVDFIFIDGNHSYEGLKADWDGWSPQIAEGGIVALHDSRTSPIRNIDGAGSVRFTNEVILHDPNFQVVETVDSLTVLKRITPQR